MTRGQRLAAVLAAVAGLLLVGRGTALLYVDRAWYASLGASPVWHARVVNTVLMHTIAVLVGTAFAYANITAVRSSIVSLVIPKRVGNMDIGEEIPSSRLTLVAAAMSIFIAGVATLALPSWTTLALWRSGVSFGEVDPYFRIDLGYYVTWLPLETAAYVWAIVLFVIVAIVVVVLYGLTPSLSWTGGRFRITTHARRHIAVLGAMLVLFVAWGFRLDTYDLIVAAPHGGGYFTAFDHQWIAPIDFTLCLVALGIGVVLLVAGWMGQTLLAWISISLILACAFVSKLVLPVVARYTTNAPSYVARNKPYAQTRQIFTNHAFPGERTPVSSQFAADSSLITAAPRLQIRGGLPTVVYPNANGVIVEIDTGHVIRAPRVGGAIQRLMNAWAEQNPTLLRSDLPKDAAVVRRRDLRRRVVAVAPIFSQSASIGVRPTPMGIVWMIDLYSASDRYPLSEGRTIDQEFVTYRRHVATAYVSATTGAVTIVPDETLDPIAKAWFGLHGGPYLAKEPPHEVTIPWTQTPSAPQVPVADSALRTHLLNIYSRMRSALDSGDFHRFGDAFDSLGAALGVAQPQRPYHEPP